jgi:hypothetical protein
MNLRVSGKENWFCTGLRQSSKKNIPLRPWRDIRTAVRICGSADLAFDWRPKGGRSSSNNHFCLAAMPEQTQAAQAQQT